MPKIRPEFASHRLNEDGLEAMTATKERFSDLLDDLEAYIGPGGREMAIVRTKLEEACFFAIKAIAVNPKNHA